MHVSYRFVTIDVVTVPGKGGRPRKWASDADRVRAFRARGRGVDEPATVPELLANGDENAAAWAQISELTETVSELQAEIRSLRGQLRAAIQELARQESRVSSLAGENQRLRAIVDARSDEVAESSISVPDVPVGEPTATSPPLNRAQRRLAEKRSRRRS